MAIEWRRERDMRGEEALYAQMPSGTHLHAARHPTKPERWTWLVQSVEGITLGFDPAASDEAVAREGAEACALQHEPQLYTERHERRAVLRQRQ